MNDVDLCIIGLGPAGLGAALKIAAAKRHITTLCLESGVDAGLRSCAILQNENCRWSQPCQIIAGVGGAALMSSGKVSSYPAGQALRELMLEPAFVESHLDDALEEFQKYVPIQKHNLSPIERRQAEAHYANKGFRFRYYPAHRFTHSHIVAGVTAMVETIAAAGIRVRTQTRVTDILTSSCGYELAVQTPVGKESVRAKRVLVATGRSGRGLVHRLLSSRLVTQEDGPIDLGVRLEFPSHFWPDIDAHHNDLKLHFKDARTFCVCKGGTLAPYRMGNIFLMEGYSDPTVPTAFTNLAITVRSDSRGLTHPVYEGIQRRLVALSGGWPVAQNLHSYMEVTSSEISPPLCSIKHWRTGEVRRCFDEGTNHQLHQAISAFASAFMVPSQWKNVSVFAPEVDYYWPRIRLLPGFATESAGLFVAGDASGRFRGILQAFLTGSEVGARVLEGQDD